MKKKYWFFAAMLLIGLMGGIVLGKQLFSSPKAENSAQLLSASEGLDEIRIDATFDPDHRLMQVTQHMELQNRTGEQQSTLILRTLANAYAGLYTTPYAQDEELLKKYYPEGFSIGCLSFDFLKVNGEKVLYHYTDDEKTVCSIESQWDSDAVLQVDLSYTVSVPKASCRFGSDENCFWLGDAFVYPATDPSDGDSANAFYAWGDIPQAECANYTVSIQLPSSYQCIGSGILQDQTLSEENAYHFSALSIRTFGLCVYRNLSACQKTQDGLVVTALAESSAKAKSIIALTQKAVKSLSKHFGADPYPTLSIVQAGIASPGVAQSGFIVLSDELGDAETEEQLFLLIARQWWAQAVCPDRFEQAWQTEALCRYSYLLYLADEKGYSYREAYEDQTITPATRIQISGDATPGAPLDYFSSESEFRQMCSERGCALFIALELLAGDALGTALQNYYSAYLFRIPSRNDFTATLSDTIGMDIAPLMLDYLDTEN